MSDLDPFQFSIPSFGGSPWQQGGQGPVNWQVAEQVASWLARVSSEDYPESENLRFDELFRVVELRSQNLVPSLPPGATTVLNPSLVSPAEWARASVREFRYTLEILGSHLSTATQESQVEVGPIQAVLAPILPALLGAQFGLFLGKLATWIWSGFDVLLPRTSPPTPKVLPGAVSRAAQSYGIDTYDAGLWICLHEFCHLRQFMVPWVRKFLASEVEKAVSEVRFDPEAVADKIQALDPSDPSSVQIFAEDPSALLETLIVPAPPQATERLRAAVALLEASAEHASAVAAVQIAKAPDKAREMMRRHRVERGKAEGFLLSISGVTATPKEVAAALVFCQFVTAEEGVDTLQRLWKSPESLPTFEEMDDPRIWLQRTKEAQ